MQYLIINNSLVVQSAGGDATTGKQVGGGIALQQSSFLPAFHAAVIP